MPRFSRKGFTLLELSIVLLIISVVMGGVMAIFSQSIEQQKLQETQVKMAEIQKALLDYRRSFKRIPCPADATQDIDATSNNYYGVEAANQGFCVSGIPVVAFTGNTTSGSSVITNVNPMAGLSVGTIIFGTGIPVGAKIVSIDSATEVTIDQPTTTTGVAAGIVGSNISANYSLTPQTFIGNPAVVPFSGDTTSGSSVITSVNPMAGLSAGTMVSGAGIPSGATIESVDSATTQITLRNDMLATATASSVSLTALSAVITGSAGFATNLSVGMLVSGTGIPAGTTIASIDGESASVATQITLDTVTTATNAGLTISYNSVVGGMVPTKALNLSDDYAVDGWGRRIMYAVDVNLTADSGFANVPITDIATNRITVKDATFGTVKTASAVYLLLSHGKNGHGAYSGSGGATRFSNSTSADADELTNCHCNGSAVDTGFSATFVQKPISVGAFDDLVVYGTRADLRSTSE